MPLDSRGLNCPFPAPRTRKMPPRPADGDRLIVECTGLFAGIDIPHLLRETGDTLERQDAANALISYIPYQARKSMEANFSPVARRRGGIPTLLAYSGIIFLKRPKGFDSVTKEQMLTYFGFFASCPASPSPSNAFLSKAIL
jgi:tRNA 2-thiouridine synthesizing protein A